MDSHRLSDSFLFYVCYAYMYVYAPLACLLLKEAKEGIESLGTRVTGGCWVSFAIYSLFSFMKSTWVLGTKPK